MWVYEVRISDKRSAEFIELMVERGWLDDVEVIREGKS